MTARYANLDPRHIPHGFGDVFVGAFSTGLTGRRRVAPAGPPAPRVPLDPEAIIRRDGAPRVTWIGHSSFLATLAGDSFLVDPVFSKRIARFIPRHGEAGTPARDLPPLTALSGHA
jgi:hypothetical protein